MCVCIYTHTWWCFTGFVNWPMGHPQMNFPYERLRFHDGFTGPFRTDGLQSDRRTTFTKCSLILFFIFLEVEAWQGLHIETQTMLPLCQPSANVQLTPGLCLKAHTAYYFTEDCSKLKSRSSCKVTFPVCSRNILKASKWRVGTLQ